LEGSAMILEACSKLTFDSIGQLPDLKEQFMTFVSNEINRINTYYLETIGGLEREFRTFRATHDGGPKEGEKTEWIESLRSFTKQIEDIGAYCDINSIAILKCLRNHDESLNVWGHELQVRHRLGSIDFYLKQEVKMLRKIMADYISVQDPSLGGEIIQEINPEKIRGAYATYFEGFKEAAGEQDARTTEILDRLDKYKESLMERSTHHFGYPYNLNIDSTHLTDFLSFSINNLGDPFVESNYGVHSREFEVEVLEWFARLWRIKSGDYWGYVTNCGTEGNLHAILTARECFPTATLYASATSHYSVFKAASMFRMPSVCIPALISGQIDYAVLEEELRKNSGNPAIVSLNIGTTVKGAVDDVRRVIQLLRSLGYTPDNSYVHCDGALYALILPYSNAEEAVTFDLDIDSMSVSGHKFLGCPMPCGVIITRTHRADKLSNAVEYINSKDTTIMGSRNGQAPIFLWYALKAKGTEGLQAEVQKCLSNAKLLLQYLTERKISVFLLEYSNTVCFERPSDLQFIKKWQLACEGSIAHVIVMPNVTREKLIIFVKDLVEAREKDGQRVGTLCVAKDIGEERCVHCNMRR